jgi:tRNA threonylcarbamoyladenosine biosynthesis protein TsaE
MHVADDTPACRRELADAEATERLGADLARCLAGGMTIHLHGELGSGKTTLVRGMLRALGHAGRVKSPTYTLVEPYDVGGFELYHFDLYRLGDPREWLDAGFRDVAGPRTVSVVEWPEKAAGVLPPADLSVRMEFSGEGRRAELVAASTAGKECLRTCCEPV